MNSLLTTRQVAARLKISPARISQIARELKWQLGRIEVVGRSRLFTPEQVASIRNRNTKPGPRNGKDKRRC